ncbi:MAG: heparin lyase I family protein, partial [Opitutaceae bacterium]|nr:heparin lyase I family protein [Opitutaceae bacterium]
MNIKTILACVPLLAACVANATLYYHIDAEAGTSIATTSGSYTATGTITAGGTYTQNYTIPHYTLTQTNNGNCVEQNTTNKFGFVVNPDGDYDAPLVLTTGSAFKGSGYLQFSYPAFQHPNGSGRSSPPGNTTVPGGNMSTDAADKVMVAFAPHYNPAPGNPNYNPNWNAASVQRRDIERYVGFALYIPTVDTMPIENLRWSILYQAFQLGTGGRPPFAITITRNRNGQQQNTVEVSFGFRDSDDATSPQQTASDDVQSTTYFKTATLKRGVWYSLVVHQKPSSNPDIGRARVWLAEGGLPPFASPRLNEYLLFDFKGKWGYPNPQNNPDRDLFSGQLGLYSNDLASKAARVLFDEIKFADTYDEANPVSAPASQKPTISGFSGGELVPTLVVSGSTVQITGSNFTAPAEVWFGDTPAASVTVNSAQSITAVVPASPAFTGRLSVHCSGWAAVAAQNYRVAGAPESLLQLEPQTIASGHGVSLSAAAVSDLTATFTWQYSSNNGETWLNAVGGNYTTSDGGRILSITNAGTSLNGYKIKYIATSAAGTAASNIITLSVVPAVFAAPASIAADAGGALYV